jgi:hypothetical protein
MNEPYYDYLTCAYSYFLSQNTIIFKADLDSLGKAVADLEAYGSEVHDLSTSTAINLITNGKMVVFLKSISDWIVYSAGWIPVRVTEHNLTQVVKQCKVRGTFQSEELRSLSFSSSVQAIIGPLHVTHISGGNRYSCLGHIRSFLKDAVKTSPPDSSKRIILTIHFSRDIDILMIKNQLSQYFGDNLHIRGYRTDGILVVKSLL